MQKRGIKKVSKDDVITIVAIIVGAILLALLCWCAHGRAKDLDRLQEEERREDEESERYWYGFRHRRRHLSSEREMDEKFAPIYAQLAFARAAREQSHGYRDSPHSSGSSEPSHAYADGIRDDPPPRTLPGQDALGTPVSKMKEF